MTIGYDVADGAAHITLDSPGTRNALTPGMLAGLREALDAADGDDAVRAIILGHSGGTFCAGADLRSFAGEGIGAAAAAMTGVLRAIVAGAKPVIAAVDGHVRAGGMGLVAACDIAYASPGSTFATTETRIGVAPAMIALVLLPRMSPRAASSHLLSGETFDGEGAAASGLVTAVAADPRAEAAAMASRLLQCAPGGLRETKRILNHGILESFDRRGDELADLSARLFGGAEAEEGIAAFVARRPPSWAPGAGGA